MNADEFVGRIDGGFRLGPELLGAFGGIFGGALAAASVVAARTAAPGRVPAGIDCTFLRALPPGDARAEVRTLHEGRTLSAIAVDLFDERDRLTTHSTVTLVEAAGLHPLAVEPTPLPAPEWRSWSGRPGAEIAIAVRLQPRLAALPSGGIASAITVPFADDGTRSAEAACLAGDLCVGAPVAAAMGETWHPHPNPDMTLRLTPLGRPVTEVVGIGRVVRAAGGQVVVGIEVRDGNGVAFAAGASTSMILPG